MGELLLSLISGGGVRTGRSAAIISIISRCVQAMARKRRLSASCQRLKPRGDDRGLLG